MEVLHFIFGVFGNATALFLFLAPTITFTRIIRSKSTEQFSGIPYVMTLLNCLLSAWYGLPFVSKNNLLVSTINGTGAGIETIYVLIFIFYAPKTEKARILGLFACVLTVFSAVALISLFALHGNGRKLFCGLAATIFSIIMYASPLSIMRLVIKTRSVEFMPFFLSLFVFLCGTSWFVYGLLGRDAFVAVSSFIILFCVEILVFTIQKGNASNVSVCCEIADMVLCRSPMDLGVGWGSCSSSFTASIATTRALEKQRSRPPMEPLRWELRNPTKRSQQMPNFLILNMFNRSLSGALTYNVKMSSKFSFTSL
ncbi:hypothetical protein J1N35_007658 [Gossypium stocksii]|uniref:Bidirectional sugar transporter SWEET n=1 Tax=Gossypium stocksii TaxID=47602 RepID=A0A9D3W9L7_9ROSI|nr:hypothetical protein J1N35_007658 [Gossypium stocksii]